MNLRRIITALFAVVLLAGQAPAQTAPALLVDAAWLSDHLADGNLVLLHVGSKQDYDGGHIPGARHITDSEITRSSSTDVYDLPQADPLRAKFASLGISDDSRIIVYFGKDAGLPSATRVIFTLDYLGLGDRTSLLNGGLAAWTRAGKSAGTAIPAVTTGKLSARPTKNVVADVKLVRSLPRAGYKLVDARAAVFYTGIEASHGESGHIPGAVSIPFTNVTDTERMISRERIAELFRNAGVNAGDTIVAYCHIGQQATAVVFAARLLGHSVLLYDGSIHDWAMVNNGPVEK